MSAQFEPLNQIIIAHWDSFYYISKSEKSIRALDGHNLDVATVLAVARYLFNSVCWTAQKLNTPSDITPSLACLRVDGLSLIQVQEYFRLALAARKLYMVSSYSI